MANQRAKHEPGTNWQQLTHPDFLHQILLKLPITSLARFKSVCKQWRSIISDPRFIHTHVHISNFSDDISRMRILRNNRSYSIEPPKSVEIKSFPFNQSKDCCSHVLGSCNGLFLVGTADQTISLWNPTTGECKDISPGRDFWNIRGQDKDSLYGLGYDSSTCDYKAVILIVDYAGAETKSHLLICSSRTGVWKDVENDLSFSIYDIYYTGITVNGCPHWLVHDNYPDCDYDRIMYFDMVDDKFKRVLLPTSSSCSYDTYIEMISIMRGHLCTVLKRVGNSCSDLYDVWEMKEHGVKESWTKLFAVPISNNNWNFLPLGFTNNGSEVVMEIGGGRIARYNLKTRRFIFVLKLENINHCSGMTRFCLSEHLYGTGYCVESLVSPFSF